MRRNLSGAALVFGVLSMTYFVAAQVREDSGRDRAIDRHDHVFVRPERIDWKRDHPALPPGAQYAVLQGDPSAPGPFTMRLRVPAEYRIPPHTHPQAEHVTVLSGALRLGMGQRFDEGALQELPAGSFFVMPPGMAHFVQAAEETTIQLHGVGPWDIRYIDPGDDPRRQRD
jgi:mannose-6-phosphate isomerase-like protein (cupin superfamily)